MSALRDAMARADRGLDWSYPCLIWVADYLRDATGNDPAADWRGVAWSEPSALRELKRLARDGNGNTDVERAMQVLCVRNGWPEADAVKQGAVMVGVYTSTDNIGVPAIFDGQDRWIISNDGQGWQSLADKPQRIWEVPT